MTQDAPPTPPSIEDMLAAWKKMTDEYLATLGRTAEAATGTPEGQEAMRVLERGYLETRVAMQEMARTAFAPAIEAAGGVPITEFQRLSDQVHTILLRLDHIDDQLRWLRKETAAAEAATQPPTRKEKKQRK